MKAKLKKLLEEKFDSTKAVEKRRGHLLDWEKGYVDAINEVYIDMGFGRLIGFRRNRDGRT